LLLAATKAAPVDPNYFAQVSAHMVDADTALFNGKYRKTLADVFVAREILPKSAVKPLMQAKGAAAKGMRGMAAQATEHPAVQMDAHDVVMNAQKYGLTGNIVVTAPIERKPFRTAAAAMTREMASPREDVNTAATRFVDMLFAHDRIEL